jgi:hypothetical protein
MYENNKRLAEGALRKVLKKVGHREVIRSLKMKPVSLKSNDRHAYKNVK